MYVSCVPSGRSMVISRGSSSRAERDEVRKIETKANPKIRKRRARRPRNGKCGNIAGELRDENYSSTDRTRKKRLDVLGENTPGLAELQFIRSVLCSRTIRILPDAFSGMTVANFFEGACSDPTIRNVT